MAEQIDQIFSLLLEANRFIRTLFSNSTLNLLIGAFTLAYYLYKNWNGFETRDIIINAVFVFTSAYSVLSGIGVILLSFDKESCQLVSVEQKTFLIGGFVLSAAAMHSLQSNLKK